MVMVWFSAQYVMQNNISECWVPHNLCQRMLEILFILDQKRSIYNGVVWRNNYPWMFTEWLDTTETEYNDTVNDLDKVEAESRRIAIAMNREKDIHVTERSKRLNDEVMKERSERKARSAGSIPPSLPYRMQARAEDMREQRIIPRELIDRTPRNLKKEWAKSMELPIS